MIPAGAQNCAMVTCTAADAAQWDAFVHRTPSASSYHRWKWQIVFARVFGWRSFYLAASENGCIRGILPIIWQRNWRGNYLSSMPHLKGGGVVSDNSEVRERLLHHAIELTQSVGASYLELRHSSDHKLGLPSRDDKVDAVLPLDPDPERMLLMLDKKTRNLVRKSLTYGMSAVFGGRELLDEFYGVYCHNMRDLGSPAYAQNFFSEILKAFPDDVHLCVVRERDDTVAAAFAIGFRDTIEIAWASSYRKYLALKPNMFLYWNLLCFAAERDYRLFDFGRSSVGSGPLQFKLQWGARVVPLHWEYWLPGGGAAPHGHDSRMQFASRIWQRLPLAVTNALGPRLMPYISGI
jgi:serine/alanine adding enzyme